MQKHSVLNVTYSFYKMSKETTLLEESRQIDAKVHIERKQSMISRKNKGEKLWG